MIDQAKLLARLQADIELLTHDRQPTAEELKIVNDLSAAVALLSEREAEADYPCLHCGLYECKEPCDKYREWHEAQHIGTNANKW